jgi:PmbA protein
VSELLAEAERFLQSANGNEEIEIYLSRGVDTEVRAFQGEIEQLSTASSAGIGVRVLIDGEAGARVGTAWAGSLDPVAIDDALREARDNVRFATEDEFVAFARPDGVAPATLQLTDPTVSSTPLDDKIAMAIELEHLVRSGDPRIRQVESSNYSDYVADPGCSRHLRPFGGLRLGRSDRQRRHGRPHRMGPQRRASSERARRAQSGQ